MIVRAELAEGAVIQEDALRREHGESVRVVRIALRELSAEGLLLRRPRVGTVVAGPVFGRQQPRLRSVGILSGLNRTTFDALPFCAKVMRGIMAELAEPKQVVYWLSDRGRGNSSISIAPKIDLSDLRNRVQGVIAIEASVPATLNEIASAGIPVVAIDYWNSAGLFDTSSVDHFEAGYQSTLHLLKYGHRAIAFAGENAKGTSTDPGWQERLRGYFIAMAEAGLMKSSMSLLSLTSRSPDSLRTSICEFHRHNNPTAYVLADHCLIEPCLKGLAEMGLACPKDVSLTCASSVLGKTEQGQPISRLRFEYDELGHAAVKLLAARLSHKNHPAVRAVLPVGFQEGETSRSLHT